MKKLLTLLMMLILVSSVFAQVQVGTVGVKAQETYPGCAGKVFGLVGASNTVDTNPDGSSIPSSWKNVKIIQDFCPGATVYLHAKGGSNPESQVSLVNQALTHNDLRYIIIDPSANGQSDFSGWGTERYKAAAVNLAKLVKDKNPNIEVIMLTNTPTKGAGSGYGTPEAIQRIKTFNADLLNNNLGHSELIDYAVNTYSATEDPMGSDSCGKYCSSDNIHFSEAGRRLVMKAVMDKVFGGATSATTVSSAPTAPASTGTENCLDTQRCKEIDDVWIILTKWIAKDRKGLIWDTIGGWRNYNDKYLKTTTLGTPSKPSTPSTTPTVATITEIDGLLGASPEVVKQFIRANLGETYIEDVEYLTRILSIERGCAESWKQERGAISQVVINRVRSGQYGNSVKDVVATNGGKSWFGESRSEISDSNRGIDGKMEYRGCLVSAVKFMMCTGEEDVGAKKIGGRQFFVHRDTQVALGRQVPQWNYINPIQVQDHSNAAHFSGEDTSNKDCSVRRYKGGGSSIPSSTPTGGATTSFKNVKLEQSCTAESLLCVIPSGNTGQEAPGIGNCRAGMVQVGNFCVDQYEASLVDKNTNEAWSPYCAPQGTQINNLKAVSVAGAVPQSTVNGVQAAQACANAGKRLCTNDQWLRVCQGTEGRKYPYGNARQDGVCNDEFPSRGIHVTQETVGEYCPGFTGGWNNYPWMIHPKNNQQENSLDAAGSNQQCKTPEGVYDLVGNAAEWINDPEGTFLGGYYQLTQANSGSGCQFRNGFHTFDYTDYSIGFRCCASLN